MKKQKIKAINSDAASYLKNFLHPSIKITDMSVQGKWLKAELSSGVIFSVKNQRVD